MILQLIHRLEKPQVVSPPPGWRLRHFADPGDVDRWLELREAAFADSPTPVRRWTRDDFQREMTAKAWWRPDALWFVEAIDRDPPMPIGTATLARRGPAGSGTAVIHWLGVLPEFRRRGVGRLLMAQLEQIVWQAGEREVALETHASWTDAVAFYRSLGYREAGNS
jgi:GNAT superfamily N-acetyltransferase